jgi:hypothetical protein
MHPLIRNVFILIFISAAASRSFAGTQSVKPVSLPITGFKNISQLDSMFSSVVSVTAGSVVSMTAASKETSLSEKEADHSSSRICSCQVLDLQSSNYDHQSVVLLSEKTNDGSSAAYTAARNRLQKEKKHLKKMFYDRIKVVAEFQGTGSCKSMFFRLRSSDKNLKLYEILNAD